MEAFSSLLRYKIEYGTFTYHPRSAEGKISHLVFVDDLSIPSDADSGSFHIVEEALT